MKVQQFEGKNGGVRNQFLITDYNDNGDLIETFQSYDSVIAVKKYGINPSITLDEGHWDYSTTTGKYRNIFLGEDKATTLKKIKSGEYKLSNLN